MFGTRRSLANSCGLFVANVEMELEMREGRNDERRTQRYWYR